MSKHSIEKKAPESWRIPENIPPVPKFRTIVADPPWQKNQSAGGSYGGAIKYYDLMSLERVKDMPVCWTFSTGCNAAGQPAAFFLAQKYPYYF